jgi:hypothetical protein
VCGLEDPVWGDRVFVNVIVTANGSPAKNDDCEGVTTTRTPESIVEELRPGMHLNKNLHFLLVQKAEMIDIAPKFPLLSHERGSSVTIQGTAETLTSDRSGEYGRSSGMEHRKETIPSLSRLKLLFRCCYTGKECLILV